MPQGPAEVAQGGGTDVLTVLVSETSVIGWIVERPCPLEVPSSTDKITHRYKSGAERAMRKTERRSIVVALGFREKILGRSSKQSTFTTNIIACPYPV